MQVSRNKEEKHSVLDYELFKENLEKLDQQKLKLVDAFDWP